MRAMVFGAGLGTRLRPLTDRLPKPAVPFFGRPLASWTLAHLAASGAQSAIVSTYHLAAETERALAASAPAGLALSFSREETLLGTGGGLRRAWSASERLDGAMEDAEVLVAMNGDILFAPDLGAIVRDHLAHDADATLVLRRVEDPFALGAIEIDASGRVVAMLEKQVTRADGLAAMFTGVHVLSRRALARLPVEGCIIRRGYRRWLEDGLVVRGAVSEAAWLDLGTPRVYRDAHLDVLRGTRTLPGIAPAPSWVDPEAIVGDDARLDAAVIGARARIEAVRVERSIVWPGAHVTRDLRDVIALPDGLEVPV